jgi:aminoglycoside/choline kinase family phosphotransferase
MALVDWLRHDLLIAIEKIELASSDASFRRYFRVTTPEGTVIVMDAPPEKENIRPFIKVARLFKELAVNVPTVYWQNLSEGFLVLEDFGQQCFLDQLNPNSVDRLYQSAFNSLYKLQTNTLLRRPGLPCYDAALLTKELAIFKQWFLRKLLDVDVEETLWGQTQDMLVASALAQPQVIVHRDFHSRNLMVLGSNSPGVIDFQDAVIGPVTYDLVSLLRDCYIAWPEDKVESWLDQYFQRLKTTGLIACESTQFKRWFDLMGMQRHLKAIGIFARLHLRDGKSGYLNDIPRTLNYILGVCSTYPELAEFGQFLQDQTVERSKPNSWKTIGINV